MMRALPVRIDGRPAPAVRATEATEFDMPLVAGILFWMTLSALAVISFAL